MFSSWTDVECCCVGLSKRGCTSIPVEDEPNPESSPAPQARQAAAASHVRPFVLSERASAAAAPDEAEDRLVQAARSGDFVKTVKAVAEVGDVHHRTGRGQNLLMLAAASSSQTAPQTVGFLLEAQCAIEARDGAGWTALHHACRNSNSAIVELFAEKKALLSACTGDGKTALILAAMDGRAEMVRLLLAMKASVSKKDRVGRTALSHVCEGGHGELAKLLIKHSAKLNVRATDGTTPVMLALQQREPKLARALLARRADVNVADARGESVLMYSLRAGNSDAAVHLIELKARLGHTNNEGETALTIAKSMGMKGAEELIAKGLGLVGYH
mmetsp:Transcript_53417/g.171130  ORF Transcript_53417/g.171130 Transcript_53417/m.171130 type:complete len:330 (+) Transcript_53417:137-1126(+)